ncbi:MAG: hypothetical protein ISS66_20300 [Desulfobacteraceae bacterium]|nr:hypothetical protein [Desulfobacteraceae bacterium]
MQCRYHPDRGVSVTCQKMEIGYCRECLDNCEACTDPCGYCKFRTQCIIWENCRKSEKRYRLEKQTKGVMTRVPFAFTHGRNIR